MSQAIAVWRLVGATSALVLVALATHAGLEYRRLDRAFYEWLDARPVSIEVDLSKPGKTTARFSQTCQISHGEALYLTIAPSATEQVKPWTLLKGLKAKMLIHDAAGAEVVAADVVPDRHTAQFNPVLLVGIAPFANGDYTFTLDVIEPAAGLAGVQQTLYAEYQLCGMERMPAMMAAMFSGGTGLIALIVGLIVAPGFWKHGLRRATPRPVGVQSTPP